jgi:hypothetical protein
LYFIDTLIRVVPAKAEVGTVNVLVKLALLEEEPETISSEVSKVPFDYSQSRFSNIQCAVPLKPALNKIVFIRKITHKTSKVTISSITGGSVIDTPIET